MTTHAPEPRYVFDTNVLISALLFTNSTPDRAFAYALDHGKILVSQPLLRELQEVLSRPKFERYVNQAEREQFLTLLTLEATLVTVTVQLQAVRDPKDNLVLELAVSGHANVIISGDADLLTLSAYDGIPIQTPARFYSMNRHSRRRAQRRSAPPRLATRQYFDRRELNRPEVFSRLVMARIDLAAGCRSRHSACAAAVRGRTRRARPARDTASAVR